MVQRCHRVHHVVIYTLNKVVMDRVHPTAGYSIACINTKVLVQIKQLFGFVIYINFN